MAAEDTEENSRVTNAVLRAELKHLGEMLQENCRRIREEQRETNTQLKALNGTVRTNREMILDVRSSHAQRIDVLERWKDGLVRNVIQWLTIGLGVGGGIGAVLFGAGKAAGWW